MKERYEQREPFERVLVFSQTTVHRCALLCVPFANFLHRRAYAKLSPLGWQIAGTDTREDTHTHT